MEGIEHLTCPEPNSGCLLFTGKHDRDGYGRVKRFGREWLAHRWTFTAERGPIPVGLFVCHRCDTPACVNPDHLFLGTARENNVDRDSKGRGAKGERVGTSKLTRSQVAEIRALVASGAEKRATGKLFGVNETMIGFIVRGTSWRG